MEKSLLQTFVNEWNTLHSQDFPLDVEALNWSLVRWTKDQIFIFESNRSRAIVKKDGSLFRIHLPILFSLTDWSLIKKQIFESAKRENISKIVFGGGFEHLFCGIPIESKFDFIKPDFRSTQPVQLDFEGEISELLSVSSKSCEIGSSSHFQASQYRLAEASQEGLAAPGLAFLEKEFPGRWLEEFNRATSEERSAYFFLVDSAKQICGFVRLYGWDKNIRGPAINFVSSNGKVGGLGPVGIVKHLRGRGLGKLLLDLSWQKLKQNGIVRVRVDWTIEEKFYLGVGLKVVNRYQPACLLGEHEISDKISQSNLL